GPTVAHVLANPYQPSQLYNPDPTTAADFAFPGRFGLPDTKPFPSYMLDQILRLAHAGGPGPACCTDRLQTHILLAANRLSPVRWVVCAPTPPPQGASLRISSGLTVLAGVSATATPHPTPG